MKHQMIAPCGLNCAECDIYQIRHDAESAERVAKWFRGEGWIKPDEGPTEMIASGMYCDGCRGDRAFHWSVDDDGIVNCGLLKCCVDEKGLEYCSNCSDFPCKQLTDWGNANERYGAALARLQAMHAHKQSAR